MMERLPFRISNDIDALDLTRLESGFGPWGLERVCRAGGGRFLFADPHSLSLHAAAETPPEWPSATSIKFSPSVMRRYLPDACSAEEYARRAKENAAKTALLTAAVLPSTAVMQNPTVLFAVDDEARLSRELSEAQRLPASLTPRMNQYFEVLRQGESDRDRIVEPRWQAGFDLAYGQLLAAQTRIEGYNLMLASLKRGKAFSNSASTHWKLTPSTSIESGSSVRKKGEKALMYLQRVLDQHPGTPWAVIAEHELNSPLGWTWQEVTQ